MPRRESKSPSSFKRSQVYAKGVHDPVARVNVIVRAVEGGRKIPGAISRSVTILEARVSDVFAIIEEALFGDTTTL